MPSDHKPVARKDAFFGLHFDLHPQKTDTSLGADITEANIADLLKRVKPDYVQYDCKGHAGYTGYPTRVGWPSPGIVKDSLEIWRKVTAQAGVGLYIHYSGVWDTVAIEHHPEWARKDAAGNSDPNNTSTFGPYVDELMIPQLNEAIQQYSLDGAWIDGDCWGAQLDWSDAALAAWKQQTGYSDAPKDRSDARWLQWKTFHRDQFEKYLSHWVDAVHKANPRVQITSNWMYSTFAPKPVVAKLDFLSGDYSPTVSLDRARTEARYLASTGMPWDLMAWGFNWGSGVDKTTKTAEQLKQEAAPVLAQGGGFQVYNNPTRSGHIPEHMIGVLEDVARFCRQRQTFCHKSESIPQVALLLSSETQFDRSDAVFTPYGTVDELEGALHALLDLHYSVDILAEHQLLPKLKDYPVVVIPDSYKLPPSFRKALESYVHGGGSLVLLGEKCARLFEPLTGVSFGGGPEQANAEVASSLGIGNASGVWQKVHPGSAVPVAMRYPTMDTTKPGDVAATLNKVGKGRVAAVYGPVAHVYFRGHTPGVRGIIGDAMKSAWPEPDLQVDATLAVEVALRKSRDGRTCVHLMNTSGAQRADRFLSVEQVPQVGPIRVSLKMPAKPSRVLLEPGSKHVPWTYSDGWLTARIPKLDIYSILTVSN